PLEVKKIGKVLLMKKTFITILVMISAIGQMIAQGVSFEAKVSKRSLGLNERLRVDFIMNENGDDFTPPSFSGFRVVVGPNQSISNSWVNGKRSFSKTYTYFLTPTQKGVLTIAQATINIDGETYKTTPLKITVTEAVQVPRDPNSPEYLIDDNLHLVAEISNTSPFLNEAITVVYKLYFRNPLRISDGRVVENPQFADFWSHNIDIPQLKVENATYKGEPYSVVIWRKSVLYPQKTGKLSLEPLSLSLVIDLPSNRRDFFGNRILQQSSRTITAGRRNINVKPLPEKGKPANFFGAVGQFDFDALINKKALKATESFEIKLKVTGKGNLKLFNLPELVLPNTLEVFEPEHAENVKTTLSGMQGNIEDNYTVVPRFQGKYPVASVSFSYFDPKKEKYFTLRSSEHIVDVYGGPVANNSSDNTTPAGVKQLLTNTDESFRFIKLNPNLEPIVKKEFWDSKLFYILLTSPLFLLVAFVLLMRRNQRFSDDVEGYRLRVANRLSKKYLGEAKKNLKNKALFYDALERTLYNYLKAKLKIKMDDFSKEKIEEILTNKKLAVEEVQSFIALLENCELARYSPANDAKMQQDFDQALSVISNIDKKL
ncbi:MAG: BatD family protein, partial [Bacteroidota bacterium]|nr:BatD family protein [Bacteroidota bacterium]